MILWSWCFPQPGTGSGAPRHGVPGQLHTSCAGAGPATEFAGRPRRRWKNERVEKLNAEATRTEESVLEVHVELPEIVPAIWRRLEIRGSMPLSQVHRLLQVAFGWEDVHLHRFTALEPFVRLRPVNGEIPEDLQWLPRQECFDPDDRPEEDLSLEQLFTLGSGVAFYEYDFWRQLAAPARTRVPAHRQRHSTGAVGRRCPPRPAGRFGRIPGVRRAP